MIQPVQNYFSNPSQYLKLDLKGIGPEEPYAELRTKLLACRNITDHLPDGTPLCEKP